MFQNTVTRAVALKLLHAAALSRRTLHIIGPPGNGKSSLVAQFAAELNRPLVLFRTSTKLPEDAGGYMAPDNARGVVNALPLAALSQICDTGCVFFIDEAINGSLAVRAGLLQLMDERRIGDRALHPDTVVVLASNPENQSTGGTAQSLPEINRQVIVHLEADLESFKAWLGDMADKAASQTWADFARDVRITLDSAPNLWTAEPPEGAEISGEGWASSRAWHIAIDTCAALIDAGCKPDGAEISAALCGVLGSSVGTAYRAILKLRGKLPSASQITADPKGARMPDGIDAEAASLAVIAQVARKAPNAAWVYASRLSGEMKLAAANLCNGFPLDSTADFHKEAQLMRNSMTANLNAAKLAK